LYDELPYLKFPGSCDVYDCYIITENGLAVFIRFLILEFLCFQKIGSEGMTKPEVEDFIE
jgi:hypothetical protein